MSKEDTAVNPKRANPLLPHDAKKLEKVSDYAAKKEAEVQELSANFSNMGYLRCLWDAKIPDKDWTFYHCFSLTASNSVDVVKEIKKYQTFYKELSDAIGKVSNPEEQSDSENINPYVIILELNEKLSKIAEAAKLGKNATASSAVYDLHKSFIQKHEKLENMIMGVECVALRDGWQKSIQSINNLQKNLKTTEEKYDQMAERFDRLLQQNELLLHQQKTLLDNNQKMEKQQEILLQENAAIKTLLRKLAKHENDKDE